MSMENNGVVSIVVPVYGTEKYLPACIESIRKQTYPFIEIILIDDQSPDECPRICDNYAKKDSRIIVVHQKNKGVSGARNTGLENATGKYIMFVDSDDELEADAAELLIQDMLQYNADIVSASKKNVTLEGDVQDAECNRIVSIYENDEMIKNSLMHDLHTHSACAKLFKKELISDVRFAEGHNINEDGYFLFECYKKHPKVVHHNVGVYKYFQREGSASRGEFSEKYFDMLYFCNLKMKYIQENMPHLLDYAKDMEVRTNLLFLQVLCRTTEKKYKAVQKQCEKTVRKLYKYHKPINRHFKIMAYMVIIGLYPIYKKLIWFKYYR